MARTLRTESKLDPKQQLAGTLYSRNAALEVAQRHAEAIQQLANVKLEFKPRPPPRRLPCAPRRSSTWCSKFPRRRKTRSASALEKEKRAARQEHRQSEAPVGRRELPGQSARQGGRDDLAPSWPNTKPSCDKLSMTPMTNRPPRARRGYRLRRYHHASLRAAESQQARGRFLAREPLVVAGTRRCCRELYDRPHLLKQRRRALRRRRGDRRRSRGRARTLLERERVALNFLQRLSGVATLARQFVRRRRRHRSAASSTPARPRPVCARSEKGGGRGRRRHQPPHGPVRRRC